MEKELIVKPEKAPVQSGDRGLEFRTLDELWRFCVACANSKEFKDIDTPEQALVRIQAALELGGVGPIWGLTNIMIVHGKPGVWGELFLGLIKRHPDHVDTREHWENDHKKFKNGEHITDKDLTDDFRAVCTMLRRNAEPVVAVYSVSDAKRAGLWMNRQKDPWVKYPTRMLKMRARAFAGRDAFPDALRGLGMVEELQDTPIHQAKVVAPLVLPDEDKERGGEEVTRLPHKQENAGSIPAPATEQEETLLPTSL